MNNMVLIVVSLITVNVLLGSSIKDESSICTIPICEVNGDKMPGWEKQIIEQYGDEEGGAIPIVFRGAAKNWEAGAWTPEYFSERFGDEEIAVASSNDDDDDLLITMQDHIKDITFNSKNSGYFFGSLAHNVTRSDYLGSKDGDRKSSSALIKNAIFVGTQLDLQLQTDFPQAVNKAGRSYFVFIGSGYTITPLHNHGSTFLAQIYGRKLATLLHPKYIEQCSCKLLGGSGFVEECAIDISKPDFEQYPGIKEVESQQTVLEAGDVLYIPEGWLHDIRGLSTSISIASGF